MIESILKTLFSQFDYSIHPLKLSGFLKDEKLCKLGYRLKSKTTYEEILSQMEAGNLVRQKTAQNGFLASYGIFKIMKMRRKAGGNLQGTVHLFRSLKNPEETKLLRSTYGVGFFQLGVYASEDDRIKYLEDVKNIKKAQAYSLTEKDIGEDDKFGQQTRETFHLSDFFIKYDPQNIPETTRQLERVVDLVFGHPYITPTIDEHMMFLAYSYSLRSGDLSRQVGAVLVNKNNDMIGVGSNDVPRFGGGPYWPNDQIEDQRDFQLGYDANEKIRNDITLRIMKKFRPRISSDQALLKEGKTLLEDTGVMDITEYNRAVHAEMSAILNSARVGSETTEGTLYCTTFPCHNCAKHIVAAGIKRVVFVEPYPKSQAQYLHGDAISIEEKTITKVVFEPFIGVSARRYLDLFSLKLGAGREIKRKENGQTLKFDRREAIARVPLIANSYINHEMVIADRVNKKLEETRGSKKESK
jgi:deoxycytidylate deaminase